ncbi:MAG: hypothetical protein A2Y14_03270 [Verrucomicrobia bacterium GWF2_51_19]|nr:MAG: hypothetical protein A2Y14_03270 [Verrucomicrobia bacterium GWF2_51_19]HCJ11516.1 hypothetical protein [Opitutae bacterium]
MTNAFRLLWGLRCVVLFSLCALRLWAVTLEELKDSAETTKTLAFDILKQDEDIVKDRIASHIIPWHTIPANYTTGLLSRFNFLLASTHFDSGRPNGGLRKSVFLVTQFLESNSIVERLQNILYYSVQNSTRYVFREVSRSNGSEFSLELLSEVSRESKINEITFLENDKILAGALENAWPWRWDLWVQNGEKRYISTGLWFSRKEINWETWLDQNANCLGIDMSAPINSDSSQVEQELGPQLGRSARSIHGAGLSWCKVIFRLTIDPKTSKVSPADSMFVTIYPCRKNK